MTAPNDVRPLVGTERAQREQTTTDGAIVTDHDAQRKREATAIALLAIHRGHEVHRLRGGEYLVTWRGVSRHCRDLAELEQHARRVGAMQ